MKFQNAYAQSNCCSLVFLSELGGSTVSFDDSIGLTSVGHIPPEAFKKQIHSLMVEWDSKITGPFDHWDRKYIQKLIIQCVTASPGQDYLDTILTDLGFQKVGPISKLKHKVTTCTFWVISGDDLARAVGYKSVKDPR